MRLKIIFPVLTVIMVAFIWIHSMMPADMSSKESGFITEIVRYLFNVPDPDVNVEHYVRKLAHFSEYLVLGLLVAADTALYAGRSVSPYSIIAGIFTPFIDETIQLFSINRSGEVADMWIDFSGYMTGFICCAIIIKLMTAGKNKA